MNHTLERLSDEIIAADTCVAFTGAGVSTASGIPDFRSRGGLWETHDPEMFTIYAFNRDPSSFWRNFLEVVDEVFPPKSQPNIAHESIAALEQAGYIDGIITQNADQLHQAAGSQDVIELHGNLTEAICRSCNSRYSIDATRNQVNSGEVPPRCIDCGSVLKPAGVLFGEQLPEYALLRAHSFAEKADVFIVAGSSLTVEPAARLPKTAAKNNASVCIINLTSTSHDNIADYVIQQNVTDVLPKIVNLIVPEFQ